MLPPADAPLAAAGAADAAEAAFSRYLGLLAADDAAAADATGGGGGLSALLESFNLGTADGEPPSSDAAADGARATLRAFVVQLADGQAALSEPDGELVVAAQQTALPAFGQWDSAWRALQRRLFLVGADGGGDDAGPRAKALRWPQPYGDDDGDEFGGAGSSQAERTKFEAGARALSGAALGRMLDAETTFSTARCSQAQAAAAELYTRGLPPQYPRQVHEAHVALAEAYFRNTACGPAFDAELRRLRAKCLAVWHDGRQLCDARSVTGRPCAFRMHSLPDGWGGPPPAPLASSSGLLRVGDRLIEVNGARVAGHASTTSLLKATEGPLRLVVCRPCVPEEEEEEEGEDSEEEGESEDEQPVVAVLGTEKAAAVAAQRRAEEQRLEVVLYKPTASARLGLVLTSRSTSHQPTVAALSAAKPPAPDRATEDDESPEDDDFDRGIDRPQRHSSRHEALHACHCGRTQRRRLDPFDLAEADAFFDAPCCAELPHAILRLRHTRVAGEGAAAPPAAAEAEGRGCHARATLLAPNALEQGSLLPHHASLYPATVPGAAPAAAAAAAEGTAGGGPAPLSELLHALRRPAATAADGGATSTVELGCEFECAAGHRFLAPPGAATAPPPPEMPPHRAAARGDLADAAVRRGPHRRLPPHRPAAANLRAHASGVGAARAVPEGFVCAAGRCCRHHRRRRARPPRRARRLWGWRSLRRGGVGGAAAGRPRLPAAAVRVLASRPAVRRC